MRRAVLVLAVLALAGCGGSKHAAATSTGAAAGPGATLRALIAGRPSALRLLRPDARARVTASELAEGVESFPDGSPVTTRSAGGDWAVAWTSGPRTVEGKREVAAYAVALEHVSGAWLAELGGPVTLRPLGPAPNGHAAAVPQVAVEIKAPSPIVDTALWVDGRPIDTRGGGLTTKLITIYGAPAAPLGQGRHVVVAFARAGTTASAAAWLFTVP